MRRGRKGLTALSMITSLALAAACASTRESRAQAAILALGKDWEARFNTRDAEGLACLYTEDCVRMPNGATTTVGRKDVAHAYAEEFAPLWKRGARVRIVVEEVVVSGGYAFARGSDDVMTGAEHEGGRWVATFRREPDGAWKFFWSTHNTYR